MNPPNLFLIFLIFLLLSCSKSDSVDPDYFASLTRSNANFKVEQECMELMLEKWFTLFNHYQEEGLDMFAADEKAKVQLRREFENCVNPRTGLNNNEKKSARR
jgi:hypothetical protein